MDSAEQLGQFALNSLGRTPDGAVRLNPGALGQLRERLTQLEAGATRQDAIAKVALVGAYLHKKLQAAETAWELLTMLDEVAKPEAASLHVAQLTNHGKRLAGVGEKFTRFLGKEADQLPDDGSRLNLKGMVRPIQG